MRVDEVNESGGAARFGRLALTGWIPRWARGLRFLLIFVPAAMAAWILRLPAGVQFVLALVAVLPLAAEMGEATEQIAGRAGAGIGGFLNATFGNAAELIIALALLFKGKDTVVKASITGSILGNLLLVLGASLLAGGLRFSTQRFNRTAAGVSATMMALAAIGLLLPAIFHVLPELLVLDDGTALGLEHKLSLAVCVGLMLCYGLGLLFSLKTHKEFYNPSKVMEPETGLDGGDARPVWSIRRALVVLLVATVFVALISEMLAQSIEEAGARFGMTEVFLGVIVVAVVGNAAEHSSAVFVALRNKMDLSVGIALGSATQVALFVAPVLVFASYLRAEPMDLLFTTMEIVAVILAVLVARMVAEDGESNWLEGAMLLIVYGLLAVVFFFLPDASHAGAEGISALKPAAVRAGG